MGLGFWADLHYKIQGSMGAPMVRGDPQPKIQRPRRSLERSGWDKHKNEGSKGAAKSLGGHTEGLGGSGGGHPKTLRCSCTSLHTCTATDPHTHVHGHSHTCSASRCAHT